MKRGDIYLVDFEPSVGAEIRKQRPALIISCNEANKHLKTVMAIPFSSKVERGAFPIFCDSCHILMKRTVVLTLTGFETLSGLLGCFALIP